MNILSNNGLLLVVLWSCGCFACKEQKTEKVTRPVKVMEVTGNKFLGKSFPAYAEAREYAFLTFRVGGMLQELNVEEGQNVKKGDKLAEIDARDFRLSVASAKANFQQAQSQAERYQRLYEKSAISKQEYEIAQAAYENNKSTYTQAVHHLEDTKLLAPFDGNIEKKFVENHQQVGPGEKIVKLSNPDKLQFHFLLPEVNLQYQSDAIQYSIELDVEKGVFYRARVVEMVTSSVGGSGVPVTLEIDDPAFHAKKTKVLPGYACNVLITGTGDAEKNAISIPLSCIWADPSTQQRYVWKVDKSTSTVSPAAVQTGNLVGEEEILILSGLSRGDWIVTAGVHMLSRGEQVKIMAP